MRWRMRLSGNGWPAAANGPSVVLRVSSESFSTGQYALPTSGLYARLPKMPRRRRQDTCPPRPPTMPVWRHWQSDKGAQAQAGHTCGRLGVMMITLEVGPSGARAGRIASCSARLSLGDLANAKDQLQGSRLFKVRRPAQRDDNRRSSGCRHCHQCRKGGRVMFQCASSRWLVPIRTRAAT